MPNPTTTAFDAGSPPGHDNSVSLDPGSLDAIAGGRPGLVIRTFQPQARAVSVIRSGKPHSMRRIHPDGVFEQVFPGETEFFPYRLSITLPDLGETVYEIEDPY